MPLSVRAAVACLSLSAFGALPVAPAAPPVKLTPGLTIDSRGLGPIRTISDADVLADGRIVVADFDARRIGLFSSEGRFVRFLDPPRGVSPENTLLPRLVALPGGGLVAVDAEGYRFLFYDAALSPGDAVPFGREIISINGFVRHPSGDLYLVGYSPGNGKILHRFDARGAWLASYVQAPDVPEYRQGLSSGYLAVDPVDGTLWLSRLTPYEILHVSAEGELLGAIAPGPTTLPQPELLGGNLIRFGRDFHTSLRVAVVGDCIVNSYRTENKRVLADVFARDGSVVATELTIDDPRSFAKRLGNGAYLRHFNTERRIEIWTAP